MGKLSNLLDVALRIEGLLLEFCYIAFCITLRLPDGDFKIANYLIIVKLFFVNVSSTILRYLSNSDRIHPFIQVQAICRKPVTSFKTSSMSSGGLYYYIIFYKV